MRMKSEICVGPVSSGCSVNISFLPCWKELSPPNLNCASPPSAPKETPVGGRIISNPLWAYYLWMKFFFFFFCQKLHFLALFSIVCYAKSLQSCPTLCDPIDGSPPGSPVPGILQARTLEWVAISFSNAWKWKVKGKSLRCVRLLATPWTAAYQAPPSMGFSRQEYWSGVPLPSPHIHTIIYK